MKKTLKCVPLAKSTPKKMCLAIGVILVLIMVFSIVWTWREVDRNSSTSAPLTDRKPMTNEEKISFYEKSIKPIVEHLKNEQWGIAALNARHHELAEAIFRRYGKPYDVEIAIQYEVGEEKNLDRVLAVSYLSTNGVPTVRLYIPTAVHLYNHLFLEKNSDWQTHFVYAIAVGYFHELDHLSEQLFNTNLTVMATTEQKKAFESRACALTCEYTIRPLLENRIPLAKNERDLYEVWVRSGRSEKSPLWVGKISAQWEL
jgi:hypothetical protein